MCDSHGHRGRLLSRRGVLAAGLGAGFGAGLGAFVGGDGAGALPPFPTFDWGALPGASEIGRSTEDRAIHVVRRTGANASVTALVVGVVHGHEPIGAAINSVILAPDFEWPSWLDLHVIPVANPDGYARRARRNAGGIDLNRDGSYKWRRRPKDGGPAGPTPESQVETQVVLGYVRSMPVPALSVWIHQNLSWVAPVKANEAIPPVAASAAAAYRRVVRLPNRRTRSVTQPGGLETTAAADVGPAILVEGAGLRWPKPAVLARHVAGLQAAIATLAPA
jgi:hypothetical protein